MSINQVLSLFHPFLQPSGVSHPAEPSAREDHAEMIALHAARLIGATLGMLMVVGTLTLVPMRGISGSMQDMLSFSGLLLGNVVVIALRRVLPEMGRLHNLIIALPLSFIVMFVAICGYPAPFIIVITALICLDAAAQYGSKKPASLSLMSAASTAVFIAGLILFRPNFAAFLLLMGVYIPILAGLYLRLDFSSRRPEALEDGGIITAAMLEAALHSQSCTVVMVDQGGMIETSSMPPVTERESSPVPLVAGQCIADAILVSDRLPLFHAISEAVHGSCVTEHVMVRLREPMPEGGYIQPPRFYAHRISVMPAKGIAGRAMLCLIPVQEEVVTSFSARALHDFVSPFNAGLGFLEMLADQQLAPQDAETAREYAAKAHGAVIQAYRNALLLARATRCLQAQAQGHTSPPQPVEQVMRDAVRSIVNGELAEDRLSVVCIGLEQQNLNNPDALRLSIQILLRAGLHAAPAGEKLILEVNGDDADGFHFLLRMQSKGRWIWPPSDAFDSNLEEIGHQLCGGHYLRNPEAGITLTLPRIVITRMTNAKARVTSIPHPTSSVSTARVKIYESTPLKHVS